MVLSHNNLTRTVSAPTGVTGWTQLDSVAAGSMGTVAWTKVVEPGEPGTTGHGAAQRRCEVHADARRLHRDRGVAVGRLRQRDLRGDHELAPYPDRDSVGGRLGRVLLGRQVEHDDRAGHCRTPSRTRRTACGADGGRVCSALADSGSALPPGPYGNLEATTNAPSDQATMWSFVLEPSTGGPPPNQPPTADFSFTCTLVDCDFDSSDSVDSDGTIASYAWDFGDGSTATEADPPHSYAAAGSYDVELTVTDDDGASDTVTTTVDVQGAPVESQIDYVGSAAAQASNSSPRVTVPGDGRGRRPADPRAQPQQHRPHRLRADRRHRLDPAGQRRGRRHAHRHVDEGRPGRRSGHAGHGPARAAARSTP